MKNESEVLDEAIMAEDGVLEIEAKKDSKRFKTQMIALGAICGCFCVVSSPFSNKLSAKEANGCFFGG